MIKRLILQKWWIVMAAMVSIAAGQSPIKLAALPTLSPDAKTVIFEWRDDLWEGPIEGGRARRLTTHPAYDGQPRYSSDGKSILFQSDRNGYMQIHQMSREGANPQPVSFLTERTQLNDIYPDGNSLLVEGVRDQAGSRPYRLLKLDLSGTKPEELLFDEEARQGRLSPDAGRLLFVREGVELYRKGYYGTQAAQIWLYDFATKQFEQPVCSAFGCLSPLWAPDGKSFYYLRGDLGVFNLHYYHLETKQDRQLTQFRDDSIIFPDLSLDGTYLVFRKGFDFWRLSTAEGAVPEKIEFWHGEDLPQPSSMPLTLTSANSADFSSSGLEIIFESEGDLWVMDTVLMKPVNLTATPHLIETQPSFSADNQYIYFVEDDGVNSQLKRIKRKNSAIYWWKKPELEQQQLTYDDSVKTEYVLSPKLDRIAYQANQGDLWVMKTDGTEAKRLVEAWSELAVSWSPDGQWLAYSREDNDFNRDIWIISADGEVGPVNVSRHPDLDVNPIWSPDGKKLAFMGRRTGTNLDIYYLYLTKEEATLSDLDEQLKKATEAMEKDPNYKGKSSPVEKPKAPAEKVKEAIQQLADAMPKATPNSGAVSQAKDKAKTNTTAKVAAPERLKIDFEDIHDRIRHIPLGQNQISSMDWAKDSKSLICATRGGRTMISASIGDKPEVKSFAEKGLLPKRVDSSSGKMFGLSQNLPAVLDNGKLTTYPFRAYSERDFSSYQRLMFRTLWRLMRDTFYDEGMNGKDWNQIRQKYEEMAVIADNTRVFQRLGLMMMGELNASHTGVSVHQSWLPEWRAPKDWIPQTAHFGVRFDRSAPGEGLFVSEVLKNGPADRDQTRLYVGDRLIEVDGQAVNSQSPEHLYLNGRPERLVSLKVKSAEGKIRDVLLRPINYSEARRLVNKADIEETGKQVEKLSNSRLGYIHIESMMWEDFVEFERQLAAVGLGKEGLVIDVRNNGGGFTTDHLLTALCQPRHAFTVPRGGGEGYPLDRTVYATWSKPIVVLCNQNSFSNAEIFSHAIRTLKRGQIVGVATAGGVISTGASKVFGPISARVPFRGWFDLKTGKDMELNGCQPDHVIWPTPGELIQGIDRQLEKAVEVLTKEVDDAKKAGIATPRYVNRRSAPTPQSTPDQANPEPIQDL